MPIAFLVGVMFIIGGCSSLNEVKRTTQKIARGATRKITDLKHLKLSDDGLKKVMAIGKFTNQSDFPSDTILPFLQDNLVAYIEKSCGDLVVLRSDNPGYPEAINHLPMQPSGTIDNFRLADIGRQYGLNIILFGDILDVSRYTEERGLLWFRDSHHFIQVMVRVYAYDMETAAKLVDESYLYETEIKSAGPVGQPEPDGTAVPIIQKAITESVDILGGEVCFSGKTLLWSGFIQTAADGRYVIPAGSRIGLSVGRRLNVYDAGTVIKGVDGGRYFKPGAKIGEIQIAELSAGRSVAAGTSAETFPAGSMVRAK